MAKIYTITKTGDDAIEIAAASYRCVKLPFPYEAQIGHIIFKQVAAADDGGTAVAFTVDILNSGELMDSDEDIPNATALPNNINLYKIMPQGTATATNTFTEYTSDTGGTGYLFRNIDGTPTVPQRYLYLLIRPTTAADATKWEFTITGLSDIG